MASCCFNTNCLFITLFCIQKLFLCKLDVILQQVPRRWDQPSLQLNIKHFIITDIENKEFSSEQMKNLLEWAVKRCIITQLKDTLHNLGKTNFTSGML